jgi:hypothetical protein
MAAFALAREQDYCGAKRAAKYCRRMKHNGWGGFDAFLESDGGGAGCGRRMGLLGGRGGGAE